jgi:hypothetical protein
LFSSLRKCLSALERWEREHAAAPLREQPPTTASSVPVEALYTPDSLGGFDDADLGFILGA